MDAVFFIFGLMIGAAAAGFGVRLLVRSRLQVDYAQKLADIEGKAKYTEGQADRIRMELSRAGEDAAALREELGRERTGRVEADARLQEAGRLLEQQKELVGLMRTEMVETFKAHAASALESSNQNFLRLAQENLGRIMEQTKGAIGAHSTEMEGIIRPLQDVLKRYEEELKAVEKNRSETFGILSQSIQNLCGTNEQLRRETGSLVTALRKPQVSGSWGQMSLKRAAELAGMAPYCDFFEEVSVTVEDGRLRPDMIVRLPNGRSIVIDAKAPVDAYLNAVSALDGEERKKAFAGYISRIRNHMNSLGMKSYWDQFDSTPEIVVMYLPGEAFFSAALENDPKLIEDGMRKKVIPATPTTLIALLRAVAFGWQQERIAEGAQEINKLGRELYDRFAVVLEHFGKVGNNLNKSVEAYNEAVRSTDARLMPSLQRFKELGISSPKDVDGAIEEINHRAKQTVPSF